MKEINVRRRPATERERIAGEIAERMDGPTALLGVIFLLVVLVESISQPEGVIGTVFEAAGWILWLFFVAEFIVRWTVAPDSWLFLRRHWWELIFLVLPFLRFARILARLRLARTGRVVSSAVRSTRTAGAELSTRLGWLAALTAIVILAASQVLYELGSYTSYGIALYDAALATISGEPTGRDHTAAQVLDVVLALYSVVVFASLAGALGAFFLKRREDKRPSANT